MRLEYNPAPPFNAGSPDTAPPEILARAKERLASSLQRRGEANRRARRGWRDHRKKAARFPERPFLSYGSSTLTGDFRNSAPGAYLPAVT